MNRACNLLIIMICQLPSYLLSGFVTASALKFRV